MLVDFTEINRTLGIQPVGTGNPLDDYITDLEKRFNLPAGIMKAIRQVETGGVAGDPNLAVSSSGALGQFQMKPATAGDYAQGANLQDPRVAAELAAKHLGRLRSSYPGMEGNDLLSAQRLAAAYNMGEGNYQRYGVGGMTDFSTLQHPEGREYVRRFTGAYQPTSVSASVAPASVAGGGVASPAGLPPPPPLETVQGGPPSPRPGGIDFSSINAELQREPTLMESVANKMGAVGDFFGRIGQAPGLKQFGEVMGAQKHYIADPLLGAALGYDPSKGETFESHTGGLLGTAAKELGVPGADSPVVGGLASGAWGALAGMASDPLMYELAALGTVLGPGGTAVGGLTGAAISGIRRFLAANQGLAKAVVTANKVTGLGFQAQMALGAATKLPKAVEQITLNPNRPEGYANLSAGLVDSYFTYHSLVPSAVRKGVSEYEIDGSPVKIGGAGGAPVPYDVAHQILSEPMAVAGYRYGASLLERAWGRLVETGEVAGEMPPIVLGIGTGARGEALIDAKGNRVGIMLDLPHIISELQANPEGARGEAFHMRMAAWAEHELGHLKETFGVPHGITHPQVRQALTSFKMDYDAKIDALDKQSKALKEAEEKGLQAPNSMAWEQLKTAEAEALSDFLSQRIQVLTDYAKAMGQPVEAFVGPEAQFQANIAARRALMAEASQAVRAEWESKIGGGLEGMLTTFMDKTGKLAQARGLPLQSPEAVELGQKISAGREQALPTTPEDIAHGFDLTRTLQPAQELAAERGLPEPPITPAQALKRPVFTGKPPSAETAGAPFFSMGGLRKAEPGKWREFEGPEKKMDEFRRGIQRVKDTIAENDAELASFREIFESPDADPAMKSEAAAAIKQLEQDNHDLNKILAQGEVPQGLSLGRGEIIGQPQEREVSTNWAGIRRNINRGVIPGLEALPNTGRHQWHTTYKGQHISPMEDHPGTVKPGMIKAHRDQLREFFKNKDRAFSFYRSEGGPRRKKLEEPPFAPRKGASLITGGVRKGAGDLPGTYSMLEGYAPKVVEERISALEKAYAAAEKRATQLEARLQRREGVVEKEGVPYFQDVEQVRAADRPKGDLEGRVFDAASKVVAAAKEQGKKANMQDILTEVLGVGPEGKGVGGTPQEKGAVSKLAQGFIRQLEAPATPRVTEYRAQEAIERARREASQAREAKGRAPSPEEWSERLRKVPAKKEEFAYTGVLDWLQEQKAAGREAVPLDDVIAHLKKHSPISKLETRHEKFSEFAEASPEVEQKLAEAEAADKAAAKKLLKFRSGDVGAQVAKELHPEGKTIGDSLAKRLDEQGHAIARPRIFARDVNVELDKALRSIVGVKTAEQSLLPKLYSVLNREPGASLTRGELKTLNTMLDRRISGVNDITYSAERNPDTRQLSMDSPIPDTFWENYNGKNEVKDIQTEVADTIREAPRSAISDLQYTLSEHRVPLNGLLEILDPQHAVLDMDVPLDRRWGDVAKLAAYEKSPEHFTLKKFRDLPSHQRETALSMVYAPRNPVYSFLQKALDMTKPMTPEHMEALAASEEAGRVLREVEMARRDEIAQLGGRSTSYGSYNRTGDPDIEYAETVGKVAQPPYVSEKTMEELGFAEQDVWGEKRLVREKVEPTETSTLHGPARELPEERKARALAGERATSEERLESLREIGPGKTPVVEEPSWHGFEGAYHVRMEALQLDPKSTAPDTLNAMEHQSDLIQKSEKFVAEGDPRTWVLRQKALGEASKTAAKAFDVENQRRLIWKEFKGYGDKPLYNALIDGNLSQIIKHQWRSGVESYLKDYIEEHNLNALKDRNLAATLAKMRKDYFQGDYGSTRHFANWIRQETHDWQGEPLKGGAGIRSVVEQMLDMGAAFQQGMQSRYPWTQHWLEQAAKNTIVTFLTRGKFKHLTVSHQQYAKTTADHGNIRWSLIPDVGKTTFNIGQRSVTNPPPRWDPTQNRLIEGGTESSATFGNELQVTKLGNSWFTETRDPDTGNVTGKYNISWNLEQAENLLKAARGVDIFTKTGELTPKAKELARKVSPRFDLKKFMAHPLYRMIESGGIPLQDVGHLTGSAPKLAPYKTELVTKAMRRILDSMTNIASGVSPEELATHTGRVEELKQRSLDYTAKRAAIREDYNAGRITWDEFYEKRELLDKEREKAEKELEGVIQTKWTDTTAVRNKAFDKFIAGDVVETYSRLLGQLGYDNSNGEAVIKETNPDAVIIQRPTDKTSPFLVSFPSVGAEMGRGDRVLYAWPGAAQQGLENKLPVMAGGRPREVGEEGPGVGFFASKGSVRRAGRETYGFDPLVYTDFRSKTVEPAKEGSYWNFQKVDHPLWEALNAPRAMITSLDLSGVLRQGLVATAREALTKPGRLAENFSKSLKSLVNEDFYQRSMAALENAPSMQELRSFGMDFAHKEEAYAGTRVLTTLAKKFGLPDFPRASERAYTYYLNRLRYELARDKFNRLKELGFEPSKDKWLFESAAKWSNIITGRGNLPTGKDPFSQAVRSAEGMMNTVLFSPRLMLSRLAMLNPYVYGRSFMAGAKSKGALSGAGAFWTIHGLDVAAAAGLAGALTAGIKAAYGGEIEDDPRSSDFGQAKIGNTRVDLTGGLRTYLTAAARILTGEQKSTIGGNIREVGALETVGRFLRGKLSPVPGTIADVVSGKKVTGEETLGPAHDILTGREPLTKESAMALATALAEGPVAGLSIPMILRDLKNLYEDDPAKAAGLALPLILGAGVTVHNLRGGLTPGLRDTFKRTMIEPMSPLRSVQTGVKDLSGKPISLDIPYMLRKRIEAEVDAPLYEKLEEMVSTPQFQALTPIQQRVAILSSLVPLYKGRRQLALAKVGRERTIAGIREKMVPEQWKKLGPPPFTPPGLEEEPKTGAWWD